MGVMELTDGLLSVGTLAVLLLWYVMRHESTTTLCEWKAPEIEQVNIIYFLKRLHSIALLAKCLHHQYNYMKSNPGSRSLAVAPFKIFLSF